MVVLTIREYIPPVAEQTVFINTAIYTINHFLSLLCCFCIVRSLIQWITSHSHIYSSHSSLYSLSRYIDVLTVDYTVCLCILSRKVASFSSLQVGNNLFVNTSNWSKLSGVVIWQVFKIHRKRTEVTNQVEISECTPVVSLTDSNVNFFLSSIGLFYVHDDQVCSLDYTIQVLPVVFQTLCIRRNFESVGGKVSSLV